MSQRALSSVLAVTLLGQIGFSDLASATVWDERRPALARAGGKTLSDLPSGPDAALLQRFPELGAAVEKLASRRAALPASSTHASILSAVPLNAASIRRVDLRPDAGAPLAIILQDVHQHEEAQRNIAAVLLALSSAAPGGTTVGIEGAFEPADFSRYRRGDAALTAQVAGEFLAEGSIAAASYVGLTGAIEPKNFVGVDDRDRYAANVAALLAAQKVAAERAEALSERRRRLNADIESRADDAARRLERARERFHRGDLGLAAYLGELNDLRAARPKAGDLDPAIARFLRAHELETSLDFARVERERAAVVRRLAESAAPEALRSLAAASLAYRSGRIGQGAYHETLRLLLDHDPALKGGHPEFDRYLRYASLCDGLDAGAVQAAARRLSAALASAAPLDARPLLEEAETLRLREKLLAFGLTPDDWAALGTSGDPSLAPFESFYREADARSRAMAANLARERARRGSPAAVLVTGGFHTDGVAAELARRGFSVAVVQPKVTRLEGSGTEYLGYFSRDTALLNQLFSGQKLFLARATTNLGFGEAGRVVGERFVAERERRSRPGLARAPPNLRSGKVNPKLLVILAAATVLGLAAGTLFKKEPAPRAAAPATVATQPAVAPAAAPVSRDPGQLSEGQLRNLRAMKASVEFVLAATDAKQTAGYRNAVHTLLMGAAYSQSGGFLQRSGPNVTLFDLNPGVFLEALIDAAVENKVTNAGSFTGVGTTVLGKPAMDSLRPVLLDLARQRSAAWAQIDAAAAARNETPEQKAAFVAQQRAQWLEKASMIFNVVPAEGQAPARFDNWIHTNGTAAAFAARLKLWKDPVPLIPRRGRPADLTPLVANHAARLGVDREAFLADYDLMPAEFRVLAAAPARVAPPAARPVTPARPVTATAPARPAPPATGPGLAPIPETAQAGLLQTRAALANVLNVAYPDQTYEEKNGIFFYLLATASHESGGFRWIQQMTTGPNRTLVPGGPAKSYFGIETWSAMDDIPYLAARSNGREWFVASMGAQNGDLFWQHMTAYNAVIRAAYAEIDKRLRDEGLTGRDLRQRTSAERTSWLKANIRSFVVDFPNDNEGPIDFDRLLVRTEIAVPFAVAKDRRYRREIIPFTGPLTTNFLQQIYPDYKARWNSAGGAATEAKFLGDGEKLRQMPEGGNPIPRSPMAMIWAVASGLRLLSPLFTFLPVAAVRLIVVALWVPLVEIWAVPLPFFAGWHRNVSDAQYRKRVFFQGVILSLSLTAAFALGTSPQHGLAVFAAGLYVFHSGINVIEFARSGGNLDEFAIADAALARRRIGDALERIGPRALPADLNMRPADLPASVRALQAMDAAIGRANLADDATVRALAPALKIISESDDAAVKTATEIEGAGLRLHVLNAGQDPVVAARALSRERRAGRHDVILTSASGDDLAFLNASAAQPGVSFVNLDDLRSGALEDTARRLGVSNDALKIIVGQTAALDALLVGTLQGLGEGRAEIFLKVGGAAGVAAALLVQIDSYRLSQMLERQLEISRLVATQA